jgi:hypothetical protein
MVWQGSAGASDTRPPTMDGTLRNASLTHLGCVEVLRMDSQDRPTGIDFIALDDIRGMLLASPSIFRAAKILFEDGRPGEIVRLPLVYGFSWFTGRGEDTDGTLTRFCSHITTPISSSPLGIGLGHQDFVLESPKGASLFGLGSVGELMMPLFANDPRFNERCRARGIDPEKARNAQ